MKKGKILLIASLTLAPIISSCGETSAVTSFVVEGESKMKVGSTQQLTANIEGNLKWKSSDPFVAEVDPQGNVRAVTIGHVTITCVESNSKAKGVFEIEVVEGFDAINTYLDLNNYIYNKSLKFQNEIPVMKLDSVVENDSGNSFKGTENIVSTIYKENAIKTIKNSDYVNYKGQTKSTETSIYQKIDNDFYGLALVEKNEQFVGQNYKFKVVESDLGGYNEIPLDKAIEMTSSHSIIQSFVFSYRDDLSKATSIEFKTADNNDGTYNVSGAGYYLFEWLGDAKKSDYEEYKIECNFTTEGKLVSATYESLVYSNTSYDREQGVLKENALIKEKAITTFSIEDGEIPSVSNLGYDVTSYFVTEIKNATYNDGKQLKIGDIVNANLLKITDFAPSKALDSSKLVLLDVINGEGEDGAKFYLNSNNYFEALTAGKATIVVGMEYNPNIKFNIPVVVGK